MQLITVKQYMMCCVNTFIATLNISCSTVQFPVQTVPQFKTFDCKKSEKSSRAFLERSQSLVVKSR